MTDNHGIDYVPSLHTSDELWRLIVRLANALERFTPSTLSRKFKLWPRKEEEQLSYDSPQECYDTLCHQVKWLIALGHNSDSINKGFRAVHTGLILTTTDSYCSTFKLRKSKHLYYRTNISYHFPTFPNPALSAAAFKTAFSSATSTCDLHGFPVMRRCIASANALHSATSSGSSHSA
jgi:hypothetical protein